MCKFRPNKSKTKEGEFEVKYCRSEVTQYRRSKWNLCVISAAVCDCGGWDFSLDPVSLQPQHLLKIFLSREWNFCCGFFFLPIFPFFCQQMFVPLTWSEALLIKFVFPHAAGGTSSEKCSFCTWIWFVWISTQKLCDVVSEKKKKSFLLYTSYIFAFVINKKTANSFRKISFFKLCP